jgi:hypothetical protein
MKLDVIQGSDFLSVIAITAVRRKFLAHTSVLQLLVFLRSLSKQKGACGSVVVKALRYQSEGLGIDPQGCS